MQNFDLLTNLISKANWDGNLYVYALDIILAIIIIIRAISNDGGQARTTP